MSDQQTKDTAGDLIRWKTDAWKDPAMVSWYSGRMVQDAETNLLKNAIEIGTIKRFVQGTDVIDIGVGTGRAALALVADGYKLTGIDSSQAMLDETRRLAGNNPITLQVGDVAKLPCKDNLFDTAVSLNVLVHFPNWRESLQEWKRVMRPGGRLIFDMRPLDHVVYAYGKDRSRWPEDLQRTDGKTNSSDYVSWVDTEELLEFADTTGYTVVDMVPYGAFLGGGDTNRLLASPETWQRWKRTLSWFSRDQGMFDLGLFLEENLISRLTPKFTNHMVVILENKADPQANARYRADLAARNAALDQRSLSAYLPWLPLSPDQYREQLGTLLGPLRSKYFLYLALQSLTARVPDFDFGGVLPDDILSLMQTWMTSNAIDRAATDITRHWADNAGFRHRHGVDVTIGSEYELVRDLLAKHFGIFSGQPQ